MARRIPPMLWALFALFWLRPQRASAEEPLLLHGELKGVALGTRLSVFEDKTGSLDIHDISTPSFAARFEARDQDVINDGFSSSVYWLRLRVDNRAARAASWILEISYPHLDEVTLYVPNTAGQFAARQTGDSFDFGQRELDHPHFVFFLDEPAASIRTYYVRIKSTGALTIPMFAWTLRPFMVHQYAGWAVLCVLYGVVLIMALYNASLYVLVKQREFLEYSAFALALGLLQLTLAGQTFQFLLPHQPWLAGRIVPASIALLVFSGVAFADDYLGNRTCHRPLKACQWASAALFPLSFLLPYLIAIRLLVPLAIVASATGLVAAAIRMRAGDRRGRLYMFAWSAFLAGAGCVVLKSVGLLPVHFLTTWAMQIGTVVQLGLLSTVLADKINSMRADLATLNGKLSEQVGALRAALERAEEEAERAERATRVKDEFMATMSHEFRTPLNAIINLPQGLLAFFPAVPAALCSACQTSFELEPDESVTPDTTCPECQTRGSLEPRSARRFAGSAEQTAMYLSKIERSGRHLLGVVNGILDFSKLESGHFVLHKEATSIETVVGEALEQMSAIAEMASVPLVCAELPVGASVFADALRLRQVLINLIGNAIKFSDGKGEVRVSVCDDGEGYVFSVRDHGIGIAKEHWEAVFASFEQVHKGNNRKYGGTGLGLSIARSLVRMHGGEMWLESVVGVGSTFYFRLPKHGRARASGDAAHAHAAGQEVGEVLA